jgi:hypothetical protein
MRPRRQHRNERLPSGLAEVELFTFWEADLAGGETAEPVPGWTPPPPGTGPSWSSLWWTMTAVALVLVVLLVLLLS